MFFCPRGPGPGNPFHAPFNGEAHWREGDRSCSYCGSMHPDDFMARLEAGDVEITPTDKNYKAYLVNKGGEDFKQTYRDCPKDAKCTGPDDCTHYVTREIDQHKFYFQHLSEDQMRRMVDLVNEKKLHFQYPGYFYRMPYFMSGG